MKLKSLAANIRNTVDPASMAGAVAHYSLPAFDRFGTAVVEDTSEIESAKTRVEPGDVLVSKLNPRIPRVQVAKRFDSLPLLASGEFIAFRPDKHISKYLVYFLGSDPVTQWLTANSQSVTRSHQRVTPSIIANVEVPDDVDKQAIASFLDRETAQIDDLIGKQKRLIALLTEKRQSVISQTVTKGLDPNAPTKPSGIPWLGNIPEHWVMTKFRYFSRILGGVAPELCLPATNGLYPYIKVSSLNSLDDKQEIKTTIFQTDHAEYTVPAGTVLFPKRGAAIFTNKVGIVKQRSAFDTNLMGLELNVAKVKRLFVLHWFRSRTLNELADTSTLPQINNKHIYPLEIALPPLEEQRVIIDEIRHQSVQIDQFMHKANRMIDLLRERRAALISAAVTGKIDVREGAA